MLNQFSRTQLLLGPEALEVLAHAHVIVFGIGGVGGNAAEGAWDDASRTFTLGPVSVDRAGTLFRLVR